MSDENEKLIFNPDNQTRFGVGRYRPSLTKSKLAEWLIKLSNGKLNETTVNYAMLAILGIIILATIIVALSSFGGSSNVPVEMKPPAAAI